MLKNIVFFGLLLMIHVMKSTKYGSFNLKITRYALCKGPKRVNCVDWDVKLINATTVELKMFLKENFAHIGGKVTAISNGKNQFRMLMDNPCNHIFLRPLLDMLFNISKDCVIQKGHYTILLNLEKIARGYYNGKYLLGNLTFKTYYYNSKCNFICAITDISLR